MKKIFILAFLFSSCLNKNNEKEIILNVSSRYVGSVYLVSSNIAPQTEYYVTKENHGIVYVSYTDFEKNKIMRLKIAETGKFVDKPIKSSRNEFYPEYKTKRITYYEFAFPTDSAVSKDSLFQIRKNGEIGREVDEFQYYFYTGIVDTSMIYFAEPK